MISSKKEFSAGENRVFLYPCAASAAPLVLVNHFAGDGEAIAEGLASVGAELSLLVVSGVDWNRDMSPWESPPAMKNDRPYTGGAAEYLRRLTGDILPRARAVLGAAPAFTAIAGYSLAGLFALYSLYNSAEFSRTASVSGSLWFPGFEEFITTHDFANKPDRIYLSLGTRESHTNNATLSSVQKKTEAIAERYRSLGVDTIYELNPGNHFKDPEARCVKGIAALIK